jgi:2-amino-4-hydroxy-6-hydroxymethyldihydropteridine diphosphokinase
MASVYLGIGSNIGDRLENLRTAALKLSFLGELKLCSSVWETEPWGFLDQEFFLNCVFLFNTSLPASILIKKILEIENNMGRKRKHKFGPRIIDIDILFYDSLIINTQDLIIPHPLLHLRKFVLLPLSEVAPNLVHPKLKKKIIELLNELHSQERCNLFLQAKDFISNLSI